MKKIIARITIVIALLNSIGLADDIANFNFNPNNDGFTYMKVQDFKRLSYFKSTKEFEKYYGRYIQKCLDNTGGGLGGIPCMIESDIWDRELNSAYKKLYVQLNKEEKNNLKQAQRHWIKERDLNLKLIYTQLSKEEGTMYRLINAGEIDSSIVLMIKQKTIFLLKYIK